MVLAIDIGTTTVVTSLIDMMTGKELGTASRINAQKEFGLDVLTRISYVDRASGGWKRTFAESDYRFH